MRDAQAQDARQQSADRSAQVPPDASGGDRAKTGRWRDFVSRCSSRLQWLTPTWPARAYWRYAYGQHVGYRYPMLWMLVALLIGIAIGESIDSGWMGPLYLLLAVMLVSVAGGWLRGYRRNATIMAWLAIVVFGAIYSLSFRPPSTDALAEVATRKPQPVAVRGVVSSAASWRPNLNHRPRDPNSPEWRTSWEVVCDSVRVATRWEPIDVRTRLTVLGRVDSLLPGDRIQVFGRMRKIGSPTNPGAFDYAAYSRRQGRFVSLSASDISQVQVIDRVPGYPLARARGWIVRALDRNLRRWIVLDQAPLAAALVFGQREQVDWQDQQELMATGTLHLLAISGMHIGIVAGAVILVCSLSRLRFRTEFLWVLVVCGLYALIAGGRPPVLRATLLIFAIGLGQWIGGTTRLANALALAAVVLLLVQVSHLYNVGTHLSFLAVASIGVFGIPPRGNTSHRSALKAVIEESYSLWGRHILRFGRGLWAAARISFWVWLMTCPLIWNHFHVVAPISILLNVLIAIPLTISLLAALLTSILGWLAPVAWCTGYVAGGGLSLIDWMVAAGKSLPWGHYWLPAPPLWWTTVFYAVTVLWLIVWRSNRRPALAVLLCCWVLFGISLYAWGPRGFLGQSGEHPVHDVDRVERDLGGGAWAEDEVLGGDQLRCTFLDVGHGTSVVVELPSGEVWLYDAGRLGSAARSHEPIAEALWSLPTARIDTLILSHADSDHFNATRGLIERFAVGRVVSTSQFWESDDASVQELVAQIEGQTRCQLETWQASHNGTIGRVAWRVLHPTDRFVGDSHNANSLCLMIEYAGKRLFLPGDLEREGLTAFTRLPPRPCHILMAPHHGSLTLDPDELLAWCRPQTIVISGNHKAAQPEVVQRYAPQADRLAITHRDGAVQVRISHDGTITLWLWRNRQWQPWQ